VPHRGVRPRGAARGGEEAHAGGARRGHPHAARARLQRQRAPRGGRAGRGDLPAREGPGRRPRGARPQPEHLLRRALVEGLGRRLAPRLRALQHPDRAVEALMPGTGTRFAALLAVLACAPVPALAQAPAPKQPPAAAARPRADDRHSRELLDQAQAALQKGDFPGAEAASLSLLRENIRVFGPDHPNVATALNLLGAAEFRQGKYNEAEGNFRRMLTINERRSGPDSEETAAALNSLALVLEKLGDYPGAETLLRRAVAIMEKKRGHDHPDTATVISNLGRVLDSQGKFAGAQAAGGGDATQLSARAEQAMARGDYGQAETLQDQVLAIHLKTLGEFNATTATSMSNLARVYDLQGKYADAEKLYRRALAVREKVLGPDHPDVATNLNNLAKVLQDLGKDEQITVSEARARARSGALGGALTEVEEMYRRALAIQDRTLGRDHPATALTLNNLGGMLALRGD